MITRMGMVGQLPLRIEGAIAWLSKLYRGCQGSVAQSTLSVAAYAKSVCFKDGYLEGPDGI